MLRHVPIGETDRAPMRPTSRDAWSLRSRPGLPWHFRLRARPLVLKPVIRVENDQAMAYDRCMDWQLSFAHGMEVDR